MDAFSASPALQAHSADLQEAMTLFQKTLPSEFLEQRQDSSPQTVFTPWLVVWLMIYQRLHHNATLASAVGAFIDAMQGNSTNKRVRDNTLSSNTGGLSRARSRLKVTVAEQAADHVFQTLLPQMPRLIGGRRVLLVDGSTITLTSNEKLRQHWPPASNQHGDAPWPICQLVLMHELESGLMVRPETGAKYGPNAESEVTQVQRLFSRIPEHSVLMADSNFGIFQFVHAATQAGHDVITRLTEPRFRSMVVNAQPVRPGVWQLQWQPSDQERRKHPDLDAEAVVPIYLHEIVGCSGQTLWVSSTVDLETATLSACYFRRGEVETEIRNSKKTLKLDELRGQSVEMIHKELAMHTIAYNLVAQVRYLASQLGQLPPKRLSFSGVWTLIKTMLLNHADRNAQQWQERFDLVLKKCLQRKLPHRPDRSFPREAYSIRSPYPIKKRARKTEDKGVK